MPSHALVARLTLAAAAGATVLTHQANKAYLARALATKAQIAPDLLAKSGRKASVQGVKNRMTLSDGTRTVRIINNIEGFQLAVDKILPLHGRVVTLADLYSTAGRTPPK